MHIGFGMEDIGIGETSRFCKNVFSTGYIGCCEQHKSIGYGLSGLGHYKSVHHWEDNPVSTVYSGQYIRLLWSTDKLFRVYSLGTNRARSGLVMEETFDQRIVNCFLTVTNTSGCRG